MQKFIVKRLKILLAALIIPPCLILAFGVLLLFGNLIDQICGFLIGKFYQTDLLTSIVHLEKLCDYLNSNCNKIYQNYIVEIVAGLFFIIAPILLGISFGKKLKEAEFYSNVKGVLNTLSKLRENELIIPHAVRHLVQRITKNFGNEALKEQRIQRTIKETLRQNENDTSKCRVCGLEAEIENNKCKYCKLNCYAWDLNSLSEEEKENQEIKGIKE